MTTETTDQQAKIYPFTERRRNLERPVPQFLSVLINLALIGIIAIPFLWAVLSSPQSPGHFIERWFHSLRDREQSSWHQLFDKDAQDDRHLKLNQAVSRVETAFKKPILDKSEVDHMVDDLKTARQEVQQSVSTYVEGNSADHKAPN